MGSFLICKSCRNNIYLYEQKEQLSLSELIVCPICNRTNAYLDNEIQQERYDFSCPICNGNFFIRKMPPINVVCPYSGSYLHISSDGLVSIIKKGASQTIKGGTITGAFAGLVLGTLLAGAGGALIGTIAGSALGTALDVKEAIYE
jgi:hypothetical protein